jgi:hypothetical protein
MVVVKRLENGRYGLFSDDKSGEQITDQTYSRESDAYRGIERRGYALNRGGRARMPM